MPPRTILFPLTAGLALLAAACGGADTSDTGAAASGPRTFEVDMVDVAFDPTDLDVSTGETVRFVFTNSGQITHDAFIGDATAQDGHGEDMTHGGGHGDDADAVTVEPGGTAELEHTFTEPGETLIGCHQPGHYEAGMVLAVNVA